MLFVCCNVSYESSKCVPDPNERAYLEKMRHLQFVCFELLACFIDFKQISEVPGPGCLVDCRILWRPVASCGIMWHPVVAGRLIDSVTGWKT